MAEEDEEWQRNEKGVTHSRVFEEVDVAPESSDEQCYIANDSQHSVDSDYQQLRILGTLQPLHNNPIILVGIRIGVHAAEMRIIHHRHLDQ